MIHSQLDKWANEAGQRYRRLCDNFGVLHQIVLTRPEGVTTMAVARADREARDYASAYLDQEDAILTSTLSQLSNNALQTLPVFDDDLLSDDARNALETHLSASREYLRIELAAQCLRDIAHMRKSLLSASLEISGRARLRGISERAAMIEVLMKMERPKFFFRDRKGRSTDAAQFARLVVRQTMIGAHNEAVMIALSAEGVGFADILKPDQLGAVQQIGRVELDGTGTLPTYAEIQAKIFHPNSTAYLGFKG